jgi:hypothetical protein
LSEVFYSYSLNAGQTWSKNVPITPIFDSHLGWPQQNKMGDYFDMVSDDAAAHLAFAATFNGEQDVYYARIGDCNTNGLHDSADIASGLSLDCNANSVADECEVFELDCNTNGVPDDCDILQGGSTDCNLNGVPDECDLAAGGPDCNTNGLLDACDILAGTSLDCNANGVPDECDLAGGTSPDCNLNGVPDECDVAGGASADCNRNGVPDECDLSSGASEDCNANGVPDECDLAAPYDAASGQLSPIGFGFQQAYALSAPPEAMTDVLLTIRGHGDFNFTTEYVDVSVDGTYAGRVLELDALDCPMVPDVGELTVPAAVFNAAAADGTVIITLAAPEEVDAFFCDPDPTWVSVAVSYDSVSAFADCDGNGRLDVCDLADCGVGQAWCDDCNTNGVLDVCDIAAGTSVDVNGNGVPDECEGAAPWCLGDANCSGGAPDFADIESFVAALSGQAAWEQYYRDNNGGAMPPCPYFVNDTNGQNGVEFGDIPVFVQLIGQACVPYNP